VVASTPGVPVRVRAADPPSLSVTALLLAPASVVGGEGASDQTKASHSSNAGRSSSGPASLASALAAARGDLSSAFSASVSLGSGGIHDEENEASTAHHSGTSAGISARRELSRRPEDGGPTLAARLAAAAALTQLRAAGRRHDQTTRRQRLAEVEAEITAAAAQRAGNGHMSEVPPVVDRLGNPAAVAAPRARCAEAARAGRGTRSGPPVAVPVSHGAADLEGPGPAPGGRNPGPGGEPAGREHGGVRRPWVPARGGAPGPVSGRSNASPWALTGPRTFAVAAHLPHPSAGDGAGGVGRHAPHPPRGGGAGLGGALGGGGAGDAASAWRGSAFHVAQLEALARALRLRLALSAFADAVALRRDRVALVAVARQREDRALLRAAWAGLMLENTWVAELKRRASEWRTEWNQDRKLPLILAAWREAARARGKRRRAAAAAAACARGGLALAALAHWRAFVAERAQARLSNSLCDAHRRRSLMSVALAALMREGASRRVARWRLDRLAAIGSTGGDNDPPSPPPRLENLIASARTRRIARFAPARAALRAREAQLRRAAPLLRFEADSEDERWVGATTAARLRTRQSTAVAARFVDGARAGDVAAPEVSWADGGPNASVVGPLARPGRGGTGSAALALHRPTSFRTLVAHTGRPLAERAGEEGATALAAAVSSRLAAAASVAAGAPPDFIWPATEARGWRLCRQTSSAAEVEEEIPSSSSSALVALLAHGAAVASSDGAGGAAAVALSAAVDWAAAVASPDAGGGCVADVGSGAVVCGCSVALRRGASLIRHAASLCAIDAPDGDGPAWPAAAVLAPALRRAARLLRVEAAALPVSAGGVPSGSDEHDDTCAVLPIVSLGPTLTFARAAEHGARAATDAASYLDAAADAFPRTSDDVDGTGECLRAANRARTLARALCAAAGGLLAIAEAEANRDNRRGRRAGSGAADAEARREAATLGRSLAEAGRAASDGAARASRAAAQRRDAARRLAGAGAAAAAVASGCLGGVEGADDEGVLARLTAGAASLAAAIEGGPGGPAAVAAGLREQAGRETARAEAERVRTASLQGTAAEAAEVAAGSAPADAPPSSGPSTGLSRLRDSRAAALAAAALLPERVGAAVAAATRLAADLRGHGLPDALARLSRSAAAAFGSAAVLDAEADVLRRTAALLRPAAYVLVSAPWAALAEARAALRALRPARRCLAVRCSGNGIGVSRGDDESIEPLEPAPPVDPERAWPGREGHWSSTDDSEGGADDDEIWQRRRADGAATSLPPTEADLLRSLGARHLAGSEPLERPVESDIVWPPRVARPARVAFWRLRQLPAVVDAVGAAGALAPAEAAMSLPARSCPPAEAGFVEHRWWWPDNHHGRCPRTGTLLLPGVAGTDGVADGYAAGRAAAALDASDLEDEGAAFANAPLNARPLTASGTARLARARCIARRALEGLRAEGRERRLRLDEADALGRRAALGRALGAWAWWCTPLEPLEDPVGTALAAEWGLVDSNRAAPRRADARLAIAAARQRNRTLASYAFQAWAEGAALQRAEWGGAAAAAAAAVSATLAAMPKSETFGAPAMVAPRSITKLPRRAAAEAICEVRSVSPRRALRGGGVMRPTTSSLARVSARAASTVAPRPFVPGGSVRTARPVAATPPPAAADAAGAVAGDVDAVAPRRPAPPLPADQEAAELLREALLVAGLGGTDDAAADLPCPRCACASFGAWCSCRHDADGVAALGGLPRAPDPAFDADDVALLERSMAAWRRGELSVEALLDPDHHIEVAV